MESLKKLGERIVDPQVSGFDLSDDFDDIFSFELGKNDASEAQNFVMQSLVNRTKTDPRFRQDIVDFEILQIMFRNNQCSINPSLIPGLTGTNRDIKMILLEVGITNQLLNEFVKQLTESLASPSPILYAAITSLCTECADNKKVFIQTNPSVVTSVMVPRLSACVDFELLSVLLAIVSDDDRSTNNPITMFVRETLVDSESLPTVEMMLDIHRAAAVTAEQKSTLLTLVRELSLSQALCGTFAVGHEFLPWALELMVDSECLVSALKYVRQISFADDLKDNTLKEIFDRPAIIENIIEAGLRGKVVGVASQLFGILANLSLRRSEVAIQILDNFPKTLDLIQYVLRTKQHSATTTQCLQFVRSIVKGSSEHKEIIPSDIFSEISANASDKTIKRICDEILHSTAQTPSYSCFMYWKYVHSPSQNAYIHCPTGKPDRIPAIRVTDNGGS